MLVADSLIVIGLSALSLGTIQEESGIQERTFWLLNAGDSAVVLKQGYTSCGCTTISYDKDAIVAPGDSAAVTLRFNPRGKGGEFYEVGTIEYGDRRKRLNLTLTGLCITGEETLMRQFPIRISDGLRLSANRFDLGIMHVGETRERTIVVLHCKDKRKEHIPVRFTVDSKTPKGLQHIAYPIKAGGRKETIILDVLVK